MRGDVPRRHPATRGLHRRALDRAPWAARPGTNRAPRPSGWRALAIGASDGGAHQVDAPRLAGRGGGARAGCRGSDPSRWPGASARPRTGTSAADGTYSGRRLGARQRRAAARQEPACRRSATSPRACVASRARARSPPRPCAAAVGRARHRGPCAASAGERRTPGHPVPSDPTATTLVSGVPGVGKR